jgi:hypothetical protein
VARDDDSIFEGNAGDAAGELRELAQEVVEQDDERDTPRSLAVSAAAMVGVATLFGFIGWWLVKGGLAARQDRLHEHDRHQGAEVEGLLLLLGSGALCVGAVLGIFALVSLAKIATKKMRTDS